jgi:hypothetical protein
VAIRRVSLGEAIERVRGRLSNAQPLVQGREPERHPQEAQ